MILFVNFKCSHIDYWSIYAKAILKQFFVSFVLAKNVQLNENMTGGAENDLIEDGTFNLQGDSWKLTFLIVLFLII